MARLHSWWAAALVRLLAFACVAGPAGAGAGEAKGKGQNKPPTGKDDAKGKGATSTVVPAPTKPVSTLTATARPFTRGRASSEDESLVASDSPSLLPGSPTALDGLGLSSLSLLRGMTQSQPLVAGGPGAGGYNPNQSPSLAPLASHPLALAAALMAQARQQQLAAAAAASGYDGGGGYALTDPTGAMTAAAYAALLQQQQQQQQQQHAAVYGYQQPVVGTAGGSGVPPLVSAAQLSPGAGGLDMRTLQGLAAAGVGVGGAPLGVDNPQWLQWLAMQQQALRAQAQAQQVAAQQVVGALQQQQQQQQQQQGVSALLSPLPVESVDDGYQGVDVETIVSLGSE